MSTESLCQVELLSAAAGCPTCLTGVKRRSRKSPYLQWESVVTGKACGERQPRTPNRSAKEIRVGSQPFENHHLDTFGFGVRVDAIDQYEVASQMYVAVAVIPLVG